MPFHNFPCECALIDINNISANRAKKYLREGLSNVLTCQGLLIDIPSHGDAFGCGRKLLSVGNLGTPKEVAASSKRYAACLRQNSERIRDSAGGNIFFSGLPFEVLNPFPNIGTRSVRSLKFTVANYG